MEYNIKPCNIKISAEDQETFFQDVKEIFESGMFTLGKMTRRFEDEFTKYIGVNNGVALSCATAGLEILLRILNPKCGEVIVPTNTNFATPAAVVRAGGKVKFVDMDPNTLSLSVDIIKEAISENTKGVLIVHLGGVISPNIKEIKKFCEENNLFLIEDAAHAHGSMLDGQSAGSFGDGASYSFYPTKLITCGEGGMLVTNDSHIFNEAIKYRDQGKIADKNQCHEVMGYSWRLSEISACLGYNQAKRIEEYVQKRRKVAAMYDKYLSKVEGVNTFKVPDNLRFNYYKYIVSIDKNIDNLKLSNLMKELYGIGLSSFVYRTLCHQQPVFNQWVSEKDCFDNAIQFANNHICIPIQGDFSEEQCSYVAESLRKCIEII